jgi:hypothetical protein
MGIASLTRQMNALTGAKQRQAALDKLMKRVDETVAGKHQPKLDAEQERFRKALLPVLKNKAYIAEFAALCRKQCGRDAQLLYLPLAGDIIVTAALDLPKITRFVTVGEGSPYGMSDEDIFRTAFANLNRRVGKLQLHDFGPVRALAFESDYNASLLLAPKAWESVPNLPRSWQLRCRRAMSSPSPMPTTRRRWKPCEGLRRCRTRAFQSPDSSSC